MSPYSLSTASQTVSFAAGQTTAEIKIAILDDVFAESTDWFGLSLMNAVSASLGSSLWGNVQIHDND